MTYEVLTTLVDVNGYWAYTGQVIDGQKKTPVSGVVPALKTNGMIKRAILNDIAKKAVEQQKPEPVTKTKKLTEDNTFKAKLKAAMVI